MSLLPDNSTAKRPFEYEPIHITPFWSSLMHVTSSKKGACIILTPLRFIEEI